MNPSDYVKKVPAIDVKIKNEKDSETKIPVDARTVAIRSLKKGNFEITEEKIKSVIEQLIE